MATPRPKRSPVGYVLIGLMLLFFLGTVAAVAWLYVIPHPGQGGYKCEDIGGRQVCQGGPRLKLRH